MTIRHYLTAGCTAISLMCASNTHAGSILNWSFSSSSYTPAPIYYYPPAPVYYAPQPTYIPVYPQYYYYPYYRNHDEWHGHDHHRHHEHHDEGRHDRW